MARLGKSQAGRASVQNVLRTKGQDTLNLICFSRAGCNFFDPGSRMRMRLFKKEGLDGLLRAWSTER